MNTVSTNPYCLNCGDRVRLTRDASAHRAGAVGEVVAKVVAPRDPATWYVVIAFEGSAHTARFSYPSGYLVRT